METRSNGSTFAQQTHREVVDVAVELVEGDKTSTWIGILEKSHGKIRRWIDEAGAHPPVERERTGTTSRWEPS